MSKFNGKILVLAGLSGCGKTTLMEKLLTYFPEDFYMIQQVTTREQRSISDDVYKFLTESEYRDIEYTLVGKTNIGDKLYGSMLEEDPDDRIGVIILNEKGLIDFESSKMLDRHQYVKIGLNKDLDSLEVVREDRNTDYLREEMNVLRMCDIVFNLNQDYVNPHMIKYVTKSQFFTNSIL